MTDKDRDILANFRRSIYANSIDSFEKDRINQTSFQTITKFLTDSTEIDYATFRTLRDISPANGKQYFTAKIFLFLRPSLEGFINSEDLIRYLHRSMHIERTILTLMRYATACGSSSDSSTIINDPSYITYEQFLEFLLHEYIPKIDPRWQVDTSFHEFYICTAAMKFFYYLDPRGSNQINIRKLAHSTVFQELTSLVQILAVMKNSVNYEPEDEKKVEGNWFNYQNALNVYHNFLELDVDLNGLLSISELEQFRGFSLIPTEFSRVALQRIFEELIVFAPYELDYRAFVRLVLALDDIKDPMFDPNTATTTTAADNNNNNNKSSSSTASRKNLAGIKFFWNIIDYDHTNMLTPNKIQYFIIDIMHEYDLRTGSYGEKHPNLAIIVAEIYDMIGYQGDVNVNAAATLQTGPSLEDILACKQPELILMMLLDYVAFDRYENRENLAHGGGGGNNNSSSSNVHQVPEFDDELPINSNEEDGEENESTVSSLSGGTTTSPLTVPNTAGAFRSLSKPAAKKIDFSQLKYDDEEDYEDDYEF